MSETIDAGAPPEILDLLIAGGGPGGTAAAFHARELGLSTLIVEYDDLMKRIRDYSKDKLILPSFGGGDRMAFPLGGELVSALRFAAIDKDEMCVRWKELHQQHGIPSRIGVELTGLERRPDGVYRVQAWDHGTRCDVSFFARHVVLALGRGVPRRFDIPGDTDGIAFRMSDPALYVGHPACVVGGGTSAAEAVIDISNAKVAGEDSSPIYWSYRGDRLPRVSQALAGVFFEAYVRNGNIRYCPRSDPAAVVVGEDRREYLSVRVDRRSMEGRPAETTHLEFPKEHCIACIGEDIPERLLDSLGVHMANGGPRNRKRMVVNAYLETAQPNVYLVGDLLSQAYFETDDFEADPATFREVKHRGNIKSALRDGVRVAKVVSCKLTGEDLEGLRVEDAEEVDPASAVAAPGVVSTAKGAEDGPPEASFDADRRTSGAFLVRVLPGGVEAEEHPLPSGRVSTLGSAASCDIALLDDTLLSPQHASIAHGEEGYLLRDDGSANGVFLALPAGSKVEVAAGDLVRTGRQFLLFAGDAAQGFSFIHYDQAGREVGRHALGERSVLAGRQAPDITLDAEDRTLSRRQLAMSVESGKIWVKDLKSVNGSYLRVRGARLLEHGQQFRIGQQLFTFSLQGDAVLDPGHVSVAPSAASVSAPVPAAASPQVAASSQAAVAGGPSIRFRGLNRSCAVGSGETVCGAAEAAGIPIVAECHAGICGSDPVRILSGHEHVVGEADDQERETLEDLCGVEAGECRLACMLRVKGPVEVELVES